MAIICFLTASGVMLLVNHSDQDKHTETTPVQSEHPTTDSVTTLPDQHSTRFAHVTDAEKITRLPILMYHDVQDITTSNDGNVLPKEQFEAQLQYLKNNGFTTITVQEFVDAYNGKINLPPKTLLMTFDDGFQSIKTIVAPLLQAYDMYATSFIIGDYIHRPDWHLTADDIQQLQTNNKHINFESHTYNLHQDGVSKGLINEVTTAEIIADNEKMAALLGHPIQIVCYPFGAYSDHAIEGLSQAGVPFAFAIHSGTSSWTYLNDTHTNSAGEQQDPRALPRVRINANMSIETFAELITDN